MTTEELKQIAEQVWEDCDGCTESDKKFWISGFMSGAMKFGDYESLPGPTELEEIGRKMGEKLKRMTDIPPDFNQIISDNFDKLV
jgi:hypothetical protein